MTSRRTFPPTRRWTLMSVRGEWSETHARRWSVQRRDGLDLAGTRDLSFLPSVPGLRALQVASHATNDTFVAGCVDLESLFLVTSCRAALDLSRLDHLDHLDVERRAGITSISANAPLSDINLSKMPHPDLTFLGPRPHTRWLTISWLTASANCLHGAQSMTQLQTLNISGLNGAPDLTPLADLPDLRALSLHQSAAPRSDPGTLDVTPLTASPSLYELQLHNLTVGTLLPLLAIEGLRRLQLFNCHIHADELDELRRHLARVDATDQDGNLL